MLRPAHWCEKAQERSRSCYARRDIVQSAKEHALFVTICRLYETYSDAVQVVEALQVAGVPTQDISLVSNNSDNWFNPTTNAGNDSPDQKTAQAKETEAKGNEADARTGSIEGGLIGAAIGATAGTAGTLIGSLALLAVPGVGATVGAGWLLGLMAAGAAIGGAGGGLLGALASAGVSEADAHVYAEGVRRGGSLVTARVSPADTGRVESVMDRDAVDIAERGADYRRSGWKSFNPAAAPYTADQVRSERDIHRAA
jgi:hypothetical protein